MFCAQSVDTKYRVRRDVTSYAIDMRRGSISDASISPLNEALNIQGKPDYWQIGLPLNVCILSFRFAMNALRQLYRLQQ
jgi:hypothetical protein